MATDADFLKSLGFMRPDGTVLLHAALSNGFTREDIAGYPVYVREDEKPFVEALVGREEQHKALNKGKASRDAAQAMRIPEFDVRKMTK